MSISKVLSKSFFILFLGLAILSTAGCSDDDANTTDFGIFSIQDQNTALMNGVIGSSTPQHWDNFIAANPTINKLVMEQCPGSEDDTANLIASRKIRAKNIAIHLNTTSEIASGAVDMFLAGTTRSRDAGSKIGVHSWSDGNKDATEFPVGHSNHQPYIDYYVEMGLSQADAESFYYFTINAAPANSIHWMTDAEIAQYKLLTP